MGNYGTCILLGIRGKYGELWGKEVCTMLLIKTSKTQDTGHGTHPHPVVKLEELNDGWNLLNQTIGMTYYKVI